MNNELLTGKQLSQLYPIGEDPERVWYYWLQKWRDKKLLSEGQHWKYQRTECGCLSRVYLFRRVISLVAADYKSDHPTPFSLTLFTDHGEAVRLRLATVTTVATVTPQDNSQNTA